MAETKPPRPLAVVVTVACAGALRAATATPQRAAAEVRASLDGSTDPFAAVVPAAALLAWVLLLWLGATVLLTLGGQLPGGVGRCAAALGRIVAPAGVRRAVELALGVSLAAGVAASAGPAAAAPLSGADTSRPAPAAAPALQQAPSLDWPDTARQTPPAAPPAPPAPAAPATAAAPAEVVVAPGDSLWSLAARALGPSATTEQVAAAWPQWWAANRDVVGDDPHLIHPGERLTPPVARP